MHNTHMEGKKDFPFGRSPDDMTYDLRTRVINGYFCWCS
jgi:hypothetical protein